MIIITQSQNVRSCLWSFDLIDIIVVFFVEEKYVLLRLKKNLTRVQIIEFSFFFFLFITL